MRRIYLNPFPCHMIAAVRSAKEMKVSGMVATRRHLLALALSVPVFSIAAGTASTAISPQRCIGEALIAEKGMAVCHALLRSNAARLRALRKSTGSYECAVADDFRTRQTVAVNGILLAEVEAALCLYAVIGEHIR